MNILITNISAFPYNVTEFEYEVRIDNCEVEKIKAKHTNESILKCLTYLGDVKKNGGINKIIALVSQKTLNDRDVRFDNCTAFEYFKNVAFTSFGFMPEIVEVKIETEEQKERELHLVINEICSNISGDDVVYIDAAGGKRTTTNVIQLVTNILEYKGIENPLTLYSDIQNNPKFITDTKAFEQLTDLADAFNEFMTSGKSNILQKCIRESKTSEQSLEQYDALVTSMSEFSDKIKLGKVDDLETTLVKLREGIEQCEKNKGDNIESVIVNQFLPIIKQKFFGESEERRVDYIKIVDWCLENDLLQQALTIFTEKIPISIFEKKIVCYNGDIKQVKREYREGLNNPRDASEWETYILYEKLMNSTEVLGSDKALISEFCECLINGKFSKESQLNKVLKEVRQFLEGNKANCRTVTLLEKFFNGKDLSMQNHNKRKNEIVTNKKFVGQLLGLSVDCKQSKNTMADKFSFVEALKAGKIERKGDFIFNKGCAEVMYGYLYVKSVRNTVNHASSEENLSEEQKKVLSELGYDFTTYNFATVKKNISKALKTIKSVKGGDETYMLKNELKTKIPEEVKTEIPNIGVKILGKIDLSKMPKK
ncbi:MAG: hypothetical protein J6Q03_08845 [Paludibacteraceae bacterium]|nr:hypothetical protein [Paludibacteraceae bacterium]